MYFGNVPEISANRFPFTKIGNLFILSKCQLIKLRPQILLLGAMYLGFEDDRFHIETIAHVV